MIMNISGINNLSDSFNKISTKEEIDKKFIIPNDPVAEGICKNVKDPIDMEEDLRFWNQVKESGIKYCKSGNEEMTFSDFKELKEVTVGFPPPSAPGRVRKAYREYMEKLPKDIRDEMQGILTFTYGKFIREKGIKPSDWKQILKIMNQHTGELGYPNTDFNFIKSCLDDFKDFDKEPKADERMRQIVI